MSKIEIYAVMDTSVTPARAVRRFRSATTAGAAVMGKEARQLNAAAGVADRYRVARLRADGTPQYINGAAEDAPWVPARVKFFNVAKGYGFVRVEGVGLDIFLHATVIPPNLKASVVMGAFVEVKYEQAESGLQAFDLRLPGGAGDE